MRAGERVHPVRRRMPPIGTHHARTELRSTRSSLGCRGGRVLPAQAPRCVQEGGKNALGGLISFFLDQVKRLKGQKPVRLNLRMHPRNSLRWRRGHPAWSVPSRGGLPGPPVPPSLQSQPPMIAPMLTPTAQLGTNDASARARQAPRRAAPRASPPARMRLNRPEVFCCMGGNRGGFTGTRGGGWNRRSTTGNRASQR